MADSKITFKDIEKVNSILKTTPIKGKQYTEVNQRIKAFRMLYPDGFIKTDFIELDTTNGVVVTKTTVGYYDDNGNEHILGTGVAHEWRNKPGAMVNKTSFIENAETSSCGRALGMLGIGIDTAVASAEEVKYAVAHQEEDEVKPKKPTQAAKPTILCKECGNPVKGRKFTDKEGNEKTISAEIVAKQTEDRFGKILCWNCAHVASENEKAQKIVEQQKAEEAKMEVDPTVGLPFPVEE